MIYHYKRKELGENLNNWRYQRGARIPLIHLLEESLLGCCERG